MSWLRTWSNKSQRKTVTPRRTNSSAFDNGRSRIICLGGRRLRVYRDEFYHTSKEWVGIRKSKHRCTTKLVDLSSRKSAAHKRYVDQYKRDQIAKERQNQVNSADLTIFHLATGYHPLLVLQLRITSQDRTSALVAGGLSPRFDLGHSRCWPSLSCCHYALANITTSNNDVNQNTRQYRYDPMYSFFSVRLFRSLLTATEQFCERLAWPTREPFGIDRHGLRQFPENSGRIVSRDLHR